ncbi:MAG TPA: nuclear transport factor 2 family protein [Microthrixaceae bacterium]|mgnify:CR=1 FL=1|nr:nuclear transport factor 2 family protein [Microthrixaceae bacterium]
MQFPDELPDHPARNASVASMTAIENGDRATWLSLFAPDAVVADPIGPSPLDPDGNGHRGLEAIAAFYDTVIGPNQVRFTIKESWEAGNEVANVGRITTTMADGLVVHTDGVFTYRIDDAGRVEALRAYWSIDRLTYE